MYVPRLRMPTGTNLSKRSFASRPKIRDQDSLGPAASVVLFCDHLANHHPLLLSLSTREKGDDARKSTRKFHQKKRKKRRHVSIIPDDT